MEMSEKVIKRLLIRGLNIISEKEQLERGLARANASCNALMEENSKMKHEYEQYINRISSAQCCTPVRNGRWMTKEYEYGIEEDKWSERVALEGDYAYCSECGGGILLDDCEKYVYSTYCPDCGAKMEEVKKGDG